MHRQQELAKLQQQQPQQRSGGGAATGQQQADVLQRYKQLALQVGPGLRLAGLRVYTLQTLHPGLRPSHRWGSALWMLS